MSDKIAIKHEKEIWYFDISVPFYYIRTFEFNDYTIGMHSHEFCEINIVTGGSGIHYIENMSVSVSEGDIFVIPSNVVHGYQSTNNLDVCHIILKREFFKRYVEELSNIKGYKLMFEIEPQARLSSGQTVFLHLNENELKKTRETFDEITMLGKNGSYTHQTLKTLNYICSLSSKLSQKVEFESKTISNEIMLVMEYVQNHLDEKLTVSELAKLVKMSKTTFNREFKRIVK